MEDLFYRDLARSDLAESDADELGIYYEENGKDVFEEFKAQPVAVIPYFDPWTGDVMTFERDGKMEEYARVRYLKKQMPGSRARRYDQPRASGVMPYFPMSVDWATVIDDPTYPIAFTEGEKKAACLAKHGIAAIGLGGVYNFMDDGRFLEYLDRIRYQNRPTILLFDSDRAKNPNIRVAEDRLAAEISLKRQGEIFLVTLPDAADGSKMGADDFVMAHGPNALHKLVEDKAVPMRKIDAAVRKMNSEAAWIDGEGMIYDMRNRSFIRKGDFIKGSRFGNEKVVQAAGNGNKVKVYNVADEWLTHPEHRIYSSVTFDPSTDNTNVALPSGGTALNMWSGWKPQRGDTKPFHELTSYLFQKMHVEDRDLPLKLMAYKAQNPGKKIPLALVLVGPQGCGKSLWAKIMRMAFEPYSTPLASAALMSDFNGWVERTLVAVIDEAKGVHMHKAAPELRRLTTEDTIKLNEKYRVPKDVPNLCQIIMTSNDRSVGAFDHDDRRNIVIDCPKPESKAFYDRIGKWIESGGPKKLLGEMLNMDLEGWAPPSRAPMSAEKYMARMENLSPIQRLAEDMREAGQNTIMMWIDSALMWASGAETSSNTTEAQKAREVISTLSQIPIRPYYTPEELALLFPMIASTMYGYKKSGGTPSGQISKELRECGIPYLECADDHRGFKVRGRYQQYLVIADPEEWEQPMSQNDFDRLQKEWPTYGMVRELQNKSRVK